MVPIVRRLICAGVFGMTSAISVLARFESLLAMRPPIAMKWTSSVSWNRYWYLSIHSKNLSMAISARRSSGVFR